MSNSVKIYNFCGKLKMVIAIATTVFLIAVIGSFVLGVDVAIEFKGGTIITYTYSGDINTNDAEKVISDAVGTSVSVSEGKSLSTGDNNLTIQFTSKDGLTADKQAALTDTLQKKFADNSIKLFDSNDVSPTTGREFFVKCLVAVIFASLIIVLYIALRFKKIGGISAGVCAVIALFHDLMVVYATFIVFRFELNANFMAVILTILGYSINDTIIIYDRIREDKTLMPKSTMREIVNTACSQTLTRSIRTSLTTLGTMVIVSVVVMISGYDSLLSFSIPLLFGLTSGAYSSIFVATNLWVKWLDHKDAKKGISKEKAKA
ncbi:MAG: protein translocase subunit SecF [Ruminococcus sp.]|nr:protein translocase subunit SecF [Ruminococcus sp.]